MYGSQQTPEACEIVTLARYARTFSAVKGLLYDMSGIDRWLLEDACYRGCCCAANVAFAAPLLKSGELSWKGKAPANG